MSSERKNDLRPNKRETKFKFKKLPFQIFVCHQNYVYLKIFMTPYPASGAFPSDKSFSNDKQRCPDKVMRLPLLTRIISTLRQKLKLHVAALGKIFDIFPRAAMTVLLGRPDNRTVRENHCLFERL